MPDNENPQIKIIGHHPNKSDGIKPTLSGKNFLLLIGVSIYNDSNIRKLPNAVKDVDDFEKILTSKYRFDKHNAIKLYNEHATSKGIIDSLRVLIKHKLKPEDSLIIYFSGHGEFDRDFNKGFWVPFEAVLDDKSTYISNIDLTDYLDAFAEKCRHIFLISDSCFSGALFGNPLKGLGNNIIETEPSRYGLTSGRDEPVSDGERGKNSPFSKHLLNTLEKNDTALGVVSLSDTVTRLVAYDIDTEQTPRADPLNIRGHQGGQFFFHLRDNEDTVFANANTIEEINFYLAKYKPAKYRKEGKQKLRQLEIQEKFDSCKNMADYHDFIDDYPNHSLSVEAEKKIEEINAKTFVSKKIDKPVLIETPIQKPIETRLPFEPEMIVIREGSFEMGNNNGEESEKPLHRVELSSFAIGKFQITLEQFKVFMDDNKYITDAESLGSSYIYAGGHFNDIKGVNWKFDPEGKIRSIFEYNHPAIHVSWNDAAAYCIWLSSKTGKKYQLPTEAQWEYVAGNGSKHTKYSWGDGEPVGKNGGNVADETKARKFNWPRNSKTIFLNYDTGFASTAPVGSFNPNEFGVYDMTGNVWEWCSDWYDENYYKNSTSPNPKGAGSGSRRMIRGGSSWGWGWGAYRAQNCLVSNRGSLMPMDRNNNVGFRVALSLQ